MNTLAYITSIVLLYLANGEEDPLTVHTTSGKVKGRYTTFEGIKVREFLGIPYAKPPVGELRFRPPLPAEPWNGVYEATAVGRCQQLTLEIPEEMELNWSSKKTVSEDCLHLNVRVPEQAPDTKLPVMVLLHGGGFIVGSSDDPMHSTLPFTSFGQVVTVSMNYRLGIFGFLNADVPEAAGNQGLLDQNLALQWVKQNIENFGGDSNRVTIYGESSGSMAVSAHVLSPLSKGLFQRAIMIGGSIVTPALLENAQKSIIKGNRVASVVGCAVDGSNLVTKTDEVLQCLRNKDSKELLQAQSEGSLSLADAFLPTYGTPFLPTNPFANDDVFTVGVELIVGTARDEGSSFLYPRNNSMAFTQPEVNSVEKARRFAVNVLAEMALDVKDDDLDLYFKGMQTISREALVQKIIDVVGDVLFVCPSVRVAEFHAANGNAVYFYSFGRNSKKGVYLPWMGVGHGTDFMFMHGANFIMKQMNTEEDLELSRSLIQGLTYFGSTGKAPAIENVQWKLFNDAKQLYMAINQDDVTINSKPRGVFCQSWKNKT